MPELPEVETIRLGLDRLVLKKTIGAIKSDNFKSFPNSQVDVERFLIGRNIKQVRRRGKVLLLDLDSGYTLITHLKMTGQLVFDSDQVHFGAGHPSASLKNELPDKSTRVIMTFSDQSRLFFNDQRKFGWMRLYPTSEIDRLDFFSKLGPEPLDQSFTWRILRDRMARRVRSPVKAAILDQSVIAGVGNIYADESLWGAKIHPSTLVGSLSEADYKKLHKDLIKILRLSIEKGGSTDRNYVDAEGKSGSYLDFACVFRREGKPCLRCGTIIEKLRVAGRGTHVCPQSLQHFY